MNEQEKPASTDSARISPTAYYTGYTWFRNGLAAPAFYTRRGHALFTVVEPLVRAASRLNGGVHPETMLLQRHRLIDHLVRTAIEEHGCGAVLELACGISPRGYRFKKEFGDRVLYIEADLPGMAARKEAILRKQGVLSGRHRVVPVDVLARSGPLSLERAVTPLLDGSPLVIVTEGLVNYFPKEVLFPMWDRFHRMPGAAGGQYVTDLHIRSLIPLDVFSQAWIRMIGLFTRGKTYLDFLDHADTVDTMTRAGFRDVTLHDPHDYARTLSMPTTGSRSLVRVVEAGLAA